MSTREPMKLEIDVNWAIKELQKFLDAKWEQFYKAIGRTELILAFLTVLRYAKQMLYRTNENLVVT